MFYYVNSIILTIFLFITSLSISAYGDSSKIVSVKYYSKYFFKEDHKDILHKIEVSQDKIKYLKSFWKVYYNLDNRIIGEEYYKNWRLFYYYLYRYKNNKIYKAGFFWHGIIDRAHFNIFKRYIWQGYFYKRIPHTLWVYNKNGQLIIKAYYKWQNKYNIDYTDKYIYNKAKKLVRIKRYREGIMVKEYLLK